MPEENFGNFMDAERNEESQIREDDDTAEETSMLGEDANTQDVEIMNLKTQLIAARADLYNYKQRTERERVKSRKLIAEDKIAEFLPVLDNLDRALSVSEDGSAKDVLIGVRMVQRQFLTVLESSGVTVIPTEGVLFDPIVHDAVETEFVEALDQNDLVLCELMRGYRTSERVLRPAQVRVGRLRS